MRGASQGAAYVVSALGLAAAFAWGFLVGLFQVVFVVRSPPLHLQVTSFGVELVYSDKRVRFARDRTDPKFRLCLRDFRGWPSTMGNDVVLDTGGLAMIRSLLLSMMPPSEYLTSDGYAAMLEAIRTYGSEVTTRTAVGWKANRGRM
jgi:hypothetical protein